MNALEQEIIEKFRQLPPESQARVRTILLNKPQRQKLTLSEWLAEADAIRFTPQPDTDGRIKTSSEWIREERDADILCSLGEKPHNIT